jgi:glycosyltransferase involved in cell wall biosynthesis
LRDAVRPIHVVVDLRITDRPGMERTGVGRYAVEATRSLCRARPDWCFGLLSNRGLVLEPNASLFPTRWPTARSWARVGWLHAGSRWELRASQFDCWVAPAFTIPFWWRGRSVVTIHDLMFLEQREAYSSRINARYATAATKRSAHAADAIICGSEETRARLAMHWAIDQRKVTVAPYGVSDVFFGGDGATSRPAGAFVLCVGTFEPRKGLDTLHAAMQKLNATRETPVELVLAGRPGWGTDETLKRLRDDPTVTFHIDPPDEVLAQLYKVATVLAYPSRAEGFGLPVAEAMAAGCPVVSSDLTCVREFAREVPLYARAGDVAAFAKALERLVDDEGERIRRQVEGKTLAKLLSWESVGHKIASQVEAVVG